MKRQVVCTESSPDPIQTTSILTSSTPEGRENELIDMAFDEVAWRIKNHKASGAELVQLMKAGSARAELEKAKLEAEVELQRVKAEAIVEGRSMEDIAKRAIDMFKIYSGYEGDEEV